MKKSREYAERFAKLVGRLRADFEIPAPEELDPVQRLVSAFLMWEASSYRADDAYQKILEEVVDFNELRSFLVPELVDLLGPRYPLAEERARRLRSALHAIYHQENDVTLESLKEMGKRDARAYLEGLEGMVPYVAAQVVLFALGGHAMPVDEQLRRRLIAEDTIDPDAELVEVQSWLERQVKSNEIRDVSMLLQGWSEESGGTTSRSRRNGSRSKDSAGNSR